jgi:hypothetical protein
MPIITLASAFAYLCGIGGPPLFSMERGKGDEEEAARVMGTCFSLLICMGLAGHRLLTIWTYPLFLTAGIFIMAFNPLQLSERTRRTFVILCSAFALIMLLFPLIYYNSHSKYRYHLDKNEMRTAAENFYRQKTGRNIPFVIGDIWLASMLQNTLHYQVKACPISDPILTGLHLKKIEEHGAIVITHYPDKAEKTIQSFCNTDVEWREIKIDYCARLGKKKTFKFFLAAVPPAAGANRKK